MEEETVRAFMVQFHKTAEKCSPKEGGRTPLCQQPGLSALQAVVLYLCQHSPLQLRIYVSD